MTKKVFTVLLHVPSAWITNISETFRFDNIFSLQTFWVYVKWSLTLQPTMKFSIQRLYFLEQKAHFRLKYTTPDLILKLQNKHSTDNGFEMDRKSKWRFYQHWRVSGDNPTTESCQTGGVCGRHAQLWEDSSGRWRSAQQGFYSLCFINARLFNLSPEFHDKTWIWSNKINKFIWHKIHWIHPVFNNWLLACRSISFLTVYPLEKKVQWKVNTHTCSAHIIRKVKHIVQYKCFSMETERGHGCYYLFFHFELQK